MKNNMKKRLVYIALLGVVSIIMNIKAEENCCGTTPFDPATQVCCDNVIVAIGECCAFSPLAPGMECCNDGPVMSGLCCKNSDGTEEGYDPATHECCGGTVVLKGLCCNNIPMGSNYECCGATAVLGGKCCGEGEDAVELQDMQVCCNNVAIAEERCCNGNPLTVGEECCRKNNTEEVYEPTVDCCENSGVQSKYMVYTNWNTFTTNCPSPAPREGHEPSSNGCSTPRSLARVNVESVFATANTVFHGDCNAHDICYDTCNIDNKDNCDTAFWEDMYATCENDPNPISCRWAADAYYWGVNLGGTSAFQRAQLNACQCCE